MLILGLTGSIAMGKSTMAMQFRQEGIPVHDADQAVHDLMAAGGAASDQVAALFPDAQNPDGSIDRPTLGRLVFNNGEARQQLEGILHPLVRQNSSLAIVHGRRIRGYHQSVVQGVGGG